MVNFSQESDAEIQLTNIFGNDGQVGKTDLNDFQENLNAFFAPPTDLPEIVILPAGILAQGGLRKMSF